jgi:hypothetical protein
MLNKYNRESVLVKKLNCFFKEEFGLPSDDYYSNLSANGFLNLKSILSDINNILTMKVSIAFTQWVSETLVLNDEVTQSLISNVLETKPNANGFDIEFADQHVRIIAEIKCNVPINGGTLYGSAQKDGIAKDINSLLHGKSKSAIKTNSCFKFMVFLDKPEIREATNHFVINSKNKEKLFFFDNEQIPLDTDNVYIVFVSF